MVRDENRAGEEAGKTSKKGWLAAAAGFVATLILAIVYLLGSGEATEPAEFPPMFPRDSADVGP